MFTETNSITEPEKNYRRFIADLRELVSAGKVKGQDLFVCAETNDLSHSLINTLFDYKIITISSWSKSGQVDLLGFDWYQEYEINFHCPFEDGLVNFIQHYEVLIQGLNSIRETSMESASRFLKPIHVDPVRQCAYCNGPIPTKRNDRALYCCDSCKTMACFKRRDEEAKLNAEVKPEPTIFEIVIPLIERLLSDKSTKNPQSHDKK
ncbi:MAG: hypothetical protein M3R17_08235 [Bacteroidota bacterium]|nr:hypothetical protein [Bacteroidota bacterium]